MFDVARCWQVAYRTAETELTSQGFTVTYEEMDLSLGDDTWAGIRKNYFKLDKYILPTCVYSKPAEKTG